MSELNLGVVVVAAGAGARFGRLKQLAPLGGKPLLARTLLAFEQLSEVRERVLVVSPDLENDPGWESLLAGAPASWKCVHGGQTRADSVKLGVQALSPTIDVVAVHDGARPFPPIDEVRHALARLASESGLAGVVLSSPMTDTVKKLDRDGRTIECTIERTGLARAQTPQVCRREALLEALALDRHVTDEGHALESAGFQTEVLLHEGWNPKITVPADLELAEAWLANREKRR